MSQENSFDVVSKVDIQNLDNAINNTNKEISNRYDLKNTNTTVELDKSTNTVTLITSADMHADQVSQVLFQKMVKLGLDIKALKSKGREKAAGDKVRETFTTINGIEQELAKKMVKEIKDLKIKVQVSIQGDHLRVSGKSKDDLQQIINFLKGKNYDIPLQFVNYR